METTPFVVPEQFKVTVKIVDQHRLSLTLPDGTTDFTMSWAQAFALADLLGKTALKLKAHISDPAADYEMASVMKVQRRDRDGVLVYFARPIGTLIFTRNQALEVAQNITRAPDAIAEELIKSGRTFC